MKSNMFERAKATAAAAHTTALTPLCGSHRTSVVGPGRVRRSRRRHRAEHTRLVSEEVARLDLRRHGEAAVAGRLEALLPHAVDDGPRRIDVWQPMETVACHLPRHHHAKAAPQPCMQHTHAKGRAWVSGLHSLEGPGASLGSGWLVPCAFLTTT